MATKTKANATSKRGNAKHAVSAAKASIGKGYDYTDAAYRKDQAEISKRKDADRKLAQVEKKISASLANAKSQPAPIKSQASKPTKATVTSKRGNAAKTVSVAKAAGVGKGYDYTDAAYRKDQADISKSKDARRKLARDEEKFSSSMRKR